MNNEQMSNELMNNEQMNNEQTLSFIREHRTEDPHRLALQSRPEGVDIQYALEQIAGWQAARQKLPSWAATEGIIYPPHLSMEQCSSEPTAVYKRNIAQRLLGSEAHTLADITGGFGVDFSYMAQCFRRCIYVERQEVLCRAARHNMPLLGLAAAEIHCADGTEYIAAMQERASMIFADPARRSSSGGRTYGIADCTPDVAALRGELTSKARYVMIKLSPMLDWHRAVEEMQCVSEVHIVSVRNECKELLLILDDSHEPSQPLQLFCVNCTDTQDGTPHTAPKNGTPHTDTETFAIEQGTKYVPCPLASPHAGAYLYEPNASLMKAGCFGMLSQRYAMAQIATDSHLFTSENAVDFPGRRFRISAVTPLNKKELRTALSGITRANIATRNFPLSVAALRKRLKLADGGSCYIFATTLSNGAHVLLICEKA